MFSHTAKDTEFEETSGPSMDNVIIGQHHYMAISSSSSSSSVQHQHQQQSSFDLNSNSIRSLRGKGNAPLFSADKILERKSSDKSNYSDDYGSIGGNNTLTTSIMDDKDVILGWSQASHAPPSSAPSSSVRAAAPIPLDRKASSGGTARRRPKRASSSSGGPQPDSLGQTNPSSSSPPPHSSTSYTASAAHSVTYRGVGIWQAAGQGSLPLCVLLWSLAAARRVSLMAPDERGNNPMHFAALADNAEVIGFLVQQTRGFFADNVRLVECRNGAGETPLLRAMNVGVIPVIRALLEESSDPFAIDHHGNSVFTLLAKNGHLWCFHYMYTFISKVQSASVALELMACVDNEGHSPLDWAADIGDVNLIEYLIRKGFNPYRVDPNNRSPLFWAVKAQRLPAVRFLLQCGCDPREKDTKGQSCIKLARHLKRRDILQELSKFGKEQKRMACCRFIMTCPNGSDVPRDDALGQLAAETRVQELYSSNRHLVIIERPLESSGNSVDSGFADFMYWEPRGGSKKRSHLIFRLKPSRWGHAAAYWLAVLVFWMLAVVVPFYGWGPMTILSAYVFRFFERKASQARKSVGGDRSKLSLSQEILSCPEKGLGLWLGTMSSYVVFLFSSASAFYGAGEDSEYGFSSENRIRLQNPLNIGGLSAAREDNELFWICSAGVVVCLVLWAKLVWLSTDPGMVDTRFKDFDEVVSNSLSTQGQPLPQLYCRTTLVRKPLRSKYCAHLGFVVARFDHYCIWLNNSIGFGNHRTFMLFLLAHLLTALLAVALLVRVLYREAGSETACAVLTQLLGRRLFFVTVQCAIMVLAAAGLTLLTAEQVSNIARNTTTNERINGSKYSWMVDGDGNHCNRFDRGWIANTLEFWQFSKYHVDYYSVFSLPTADPSPPPTPPYHHPAPTPPPSPSTLPSCCRCHCCTSCCRAAARQEQDAELRPLEQQQSSEDLEMNLQRTAAIVIAPPAQQQQQQQQQQQRALTPRHSNSSTDSSVSTISMSNNNNNNSSSNSSSCSALPAAGPGGPQSIMSPTSIQLLSNIGQRPSSQLDAPFNPSSSSNSGSSGSGATAAVYGPSLLLRSSSRPPFNHSHLDMEMVQSKPRSDSTDSSETTTLGEREFL